MSRSPATYPNTKPPCRGPRNKSDRIMNPRNSKRFMNLGGECLEVVHGRFQFLGGGRRLSTRYREKACEHFDLPTTFAAVNFQLSTHPLSTVLRFCPWLK